MISSIMLSNFVKKATVSAFSTPFATRTAMSSSSALLTSSLKTSNFDILKSFQTTSTAQRSIFLAPRISKEFKKIRTTTTSLRFQVNDANQNSAANNNDDGKSSTGSVYPSFHAAAYSLPPFPSTIPTSKLKKNQRIVTFGDVHGDINALVNFLVTAKIMDPKSTSSHPIWNGGDTICVQCGDILDRGDDELACLRLLTSLSRQAEDQGGALVMCYGNHEALNAVGLFQYANPGGNEEFEKFLGKNMDQDWNSERWRLQFAGNQPARWAAFEPGGLLAQQMLANMKVAVVVGKTVFVHAGLTKEHLQEYESIEAMNMEAMKWITRSQHGPNNNLGEYAKIEQVVEAAESRARAHSSTMPNCLGGGIGSPSPVWMRDYSQPHDAPPSNPLAQKMINEALEYLSSSIDPEGNFKVERMVMGHTPQMHINAALQGKAWRVDVGASRGVMSGIPEVLEIIHGGEDEEDVISILSMNSGDKPIAAKERYLMEMPF